VLDSLGSAPKQTQKFMAAGDWDMKWSYDCTGRPGPDNFIANIYDELGHLPSNAPGLYKIGIKGSGAQQYHTGGTYYISINSQCAWHITVKA
jgi:hypothetical protein